MKTQPLLERLINWRLKHISDRQFMLILSVVVGLSVGFAAVIIKNSVHFIKHLLTRASPTSTRTTSISFTPPSGYWGPCFSSGMS